MVAAWCRVVEVAVGAAVFGEGCVFEVFGCHVCVLDDGVFDAVEPPALLAVLDSACCCWASQLVYRVLMVVA